MIDRLIQWVQKHNFFIFPCEAGRKKPEIFAWEDKASNDPAQIQKWATMFPNCNWGLAAGRSGLVILDIDEKDGKQGGLNLRSWLEENKGDIPKTLKVTTPTGGEHHYYKGTGGNRADFVKGNDIRGKGGYVILPPSTIGGRFYACENPVADIAPAPEWLLTFARSTGEKNENRSTPLCEPDQPENVKRAADWLEQAPAAVEGQGGDALTFRTVCRVRDFGISDETCLYMLLQHWNERCSPPWGEEELRIKVSNAYRYSRDAAGNATPEGQSVKFGELFEPVKIETATRHFRDIGLTKPERHWLVEGWIPQGGTSPTLFAGDGGTGKSQLALQLGVSLAAGRLWLGMATKQTPVLYVSCEDDDDELDRRVFDIRKQDPFSPDDRPFWTMCRVGKQSLLCIGENGRVRPGPFYTELDTTLEQLPEGPKVLFLDTAADMASIDENNRTEVNSFVKVILCSLGRKHHATVILIAHPSKAVGSTYSGSTAWNNAVRNRLFLKYQDPKKKGSYRILSNEKANYSAAGGEILLQYDRGSYVPVETIELYSVLETAVTEAILEAETIGSPVSLSKQSPRFLGDVPIIGPKGEPVSVKDVLACASELIRKGKVRHVSGKNRGNGLYVSPEQKEGWMD